MYQRALHAGLALVAGGGLAFGGAAANASATPVAGKDRPSQPAAGSYRVSTVLEGSSLAHRVGASTEPLTKPDDIVSMHGMLFVGFQNGVGSMGEPSSTGNTDSTLVELTPAGAVLGQWDLIGKIDGMGADPAHQRVIATVDEDGSSSLYTVDPGANGPQVHHYAYDLNPLPHGGGTDAVSVYHGRILISASAPTASGGPAVYAAHLDPARGLVSLTPVFYDDSTATSATTGAPTALALTDPDSNTVVPGSSARFPGDFVLDSQGDQQQIYVHDAGGPDQNLTVLDLAQSVDDTAWATSPKGVLYVTDATRDTVDAVTGTFRPGQAFVVATPCDANSAPSNCGPNYLGHLDLADGAISPMDVTGAPLVPHAAVFVGRSGE